jgi:hypothetical protein
MSKRAAVHHHAVQFYAADSTLCQTVANFLAEGLVKGEPALVVATAPHRIEIVEHLGARLIDCNRAIREGDLLLLDAQATLDLFMVDGDVKATMFFDNVARVLDQTLNGRKTALRAYGEMVDLLWRSGWQEAALKLETLWNQLALRYRFSLLCGYSLSNFYAQPEAIDRVCTHHSHVVSDPSKVLRFPARAERTPS